MTGTLRSRAPVSSRGADPTAGVQICALPSTITSPRESPSRMADPERHSLASACRALAFRLPRTRSGLGPRRDRSGEPGLPARLRCYRVSRDRTHADHSEILDWDPDAAAGSGIQSVRRDADAIGNASANRRRPAPEPRGLQLRIRRT